MKRNKVRNLLVVLAVAVATSSPLAAASCDNSGNWRQEKTVFAPDLQGQVSANVSDSNKGWTVIKVNHHWKTEKSSWYQHELKDKSIQLDGSRKSLWKETIKTSDNTNPTTDRVRVRFEHTDGTRLECSVYFQGKQFGGTDRARFQRADCWDETGAETPVDSDHPNFTCERNFLNGQNRFNVVLKIKDQ